jgi:putative membrane protein
MKIIFRIVTVLLFVLFFSFALKNTQEASLQFFLDYQWTGPLVLLLLGFFVGGAIMGVLAMSPTLFRYRREVARQKKAIAALEKAQQASLSSPPDTLVNIDRTVL